MMQPSPPDISSLQPNRRDNDPCSSYPNRWQLSAARANTTARKHADGRRVLVQLLGPAAALRARTDLAAQRDDRAPQTSRCHHPRALYRRILDRLSKRIPCMACQPTQPAHGRAAQPGSPDRLRGSTRNGRAHGNLRQDQTDNPALAHGATDPGLRHQWSMGGLHPRTPTGAEHQREHRKDQLDPRRSKVLQHRTRDTPARLRLKPPLTRNDCPMSQGSNAGVKRNRRPTGTKSVERKIHLDPATAAAIAAASKASGQMSFSLYLERLISQLEAELGALPVLSPTLDGTEVITKRAA